MLVDLVQISLEPVDYCDMLASWPPPVTAKHTTCYLHMTDRNNERTLQNHIACIMWVGNVLAGSLWIWKQILWHEALLHRAMPSAVHMTTVLLILRNFWLTFIRKFFVFKMTFKIDTAWKPKATKVAYLHEYAPVLSYPWCSCCSLPDTIVMHMHIALSVWWNYLISLKQWLFTCYLKNIRLSP